MNWRSKHSPDSSLSLGVRCRVEHVTLNADKNSREVFVGELAFRDVARTSRLANVGLKTSAARRVNTLKSETDTEHYGDLNEYL